MPVDRNLMPSFQKGYVTTLSEYNMTQARTMPNV